MFAIKKYLPSLGRNLPFENENSRQEGALKALLILSLLTGLNFGHQCILSAVKVLIQEDLHMNDAASAMPAAAMSTASLFFALVMGWVADQNWFERRFLLCFCVILWSLGTALAGLSSSLGELIFWRALVGAGTGAFNVICPVMLADFFPIAERNLVYGIFALSIPVGAALGFAFGAFFAGLYGWRVAFYIVGFPGVVFAFAVYLCNDPARGVNDATLECKETGEVELVEGAGGGMDTSKNRYSAAATSTQFEGGEGIPGSGPDEEMQYKDENDDNDMIALRSADATADSSDFGAPVRATRHNSTNSSGAVANTTYSDLVEIFTSKEYAVGVLGLTLCNFALAGMTDWLPTFLYRYCSVGLNEAGVAVGGSVVIGGVMGTLLGAKSASHYELKVKSAFFFIPALYTLPASFFFFMIFNATADKYATYLYLFLSMVCVWTCIAPIGAVTVTVIRPELRTSAAGIAHVFVSLLGNVPAPPIIGAISDISGLRNGMQIIWMASLLSGVCYWWGYQFLPPLVTRLEDHSAGQTMTFYTFFHGSSDEKGKLEVEDAAAVVDESGSIGGHSGHKESEVVVLGPGEVENPLQEFGLVKMT